MNEDKRLYYLEQMGIQAWVSQTNSDTKLQDKVMVTNHVANEENSEQAIKKTPDSANLDELRQVVS
ncbi:MAG: hypothetical protein ACRBDX_03355, partial [Gammaproteobacteria bacterium]